MSQWGRRAVGAPGVAAAPASRLAKRSIPSAVSAYVMAAAAVAVAFLMPADAPLPAPTLVPLALGIVFAIVVPIIHVVGIVYGARALSRPEESRGMAVLGIALNLLSVVVVVVALWTLMGPQAG